MISYKLLSNINQSQVTAWTQKYDLESTLFMQSEKLSSEYKTLLDKQDNKVRLYSSISIGAGCGAGAALIKQPPETIIITAVAGFGVSYMYGIISRLF